MQLYFFQQQIAGANYFMTYHTILRTSKDYYTALAEARETARNITTAINSHNSNDSNNSTIDGHVEVFPYSVFYVYYEQYLTIVQETWVSLGVSVLAVFAVMLLLSGFDFYTSLAVLLTLAILVQDMLALMCWFGVSLNAVSLVNLIMVSNYGCVIDDRLYNYWRSRSIR